MAQPSQVRFTLTECTSNIAALFLSLSLSSLWQSVQDGLTKGSRKLALLSLSGYKPGACTPGYTVRKMMMMMMMSEPFIDFLDTRSHRVNY
jgi:hypothetical protein